MFPPLSFISQLTKLSGRNFLDSLPEVRHRRRDLWDNFSPNPSTSDLLDPSSAPATSGFLRRSSPGRGSVQGTMNWHQVTALAEQLTTSVNSTEDTLPSILRSHCSPGAQHLSEETLQALLQTLCLCVRPSRQELPARGGHWGVGEGTKSNIYIFHGRINTLLQVTSKDLPSSFPSPPEKCYFFVGKLRQPKLAQPSSSLGSKASLLWALGLVFPTGVWIHLNPAVFFIFLLSLDRNLKERDSHNQPVKRAIQQLQRLSQGKINPGEKQRLIYRSHSKSKDFMVDP